MERISLLVKNAYIITMDRDRRVLPDAYLAVDKDRILAVGPMTEMAEYEADRVIDARGKAVFPGLIDSHMHMFQTIVKGLGRDKYLLDWLDSSVRPALYKMDPELVYHTALIACIESIRSGCTTVLDYMYAHAVPGTDEGVVRAMDETGIRGILGRGHADTTVMPASFHITYHETERDFIEETVAMHEKLKDHSRLDAVFAPGFIFDLSEEGFLEMRRAADAEGIKMTMHLQETDDDDEFCLEKNGMRTPEYFEKLGVLGPDFLAVHTVVSNADDIRVFARNDVKISYNPVSNMILANGVAPVVEMRDAGLAVSIACDGAGSNDSQNMLEALKFAALVQKGGRKDPTVIPAQTALEMATVEGARAVWMEDSVGSLEKGKKADFFLYDPLVYTSVPVYDPVSSLVYCSSPQNVQTVVIDGKVVMEDRKILTVDEERAAKDVQKIAQGLAKELGLGNIQWGSRMPFFNGLA